MSFIEERKVIIMREFLALCPDDEEGFCDIVNRVTGSYTLEQCFQIIKESKIPPSKLGAEEPAAFDNWLEFFQMVAFDILVTELLEEYPQYFAPVLQ